MDAAIVHPAAAPRELVRQVPVPAAARARSTLERIDYADAFRLRDRGSAELPAESWARAVLCDAPLEARSRLLAGWTALGLKLGRDATILGWTVRERSPEVLLLGAESRIGMPAELLFEREPGGLLFCTFVQQDTAVGRAAWAGIQAIHVRTVRSLLQAAAERGRGR